MIEFITPALKNYRLELFEKLDMKYSIKFIFTGHEEVREFGGMTIPKSWNYENTNIISARGLDIINTNHFTSWLRFARSLLRDKYELILSSPAENYYNLITLIVSKLRFKKIIFWGESWYWPSSRIILKLYHYVLVKSMLAQGDAIIAMGGKQYAFYVNTLKKKTGIFYAPKYVVPYKKRDAAKLIETLSLEDSRILGKKIILYMSQITRRKGLDYLIRAFRLLEDKCDNVYLLIAGSGEFEGYCKKLANNLGVKNILFTGYVDESDVELYHNVCDVLVLPSIFLDDYPEPDGYVVYESMSVGKPLVVTDATGAAEMIREGENGFVVKERNAAELAEALYKILADETLQEKMSNESKKIFEEKISLEKQFEAFKAAIDFVQGKRIS